jgi:hypothetical protein
MKKLIFSCLILLLIISCKSNTKPTNANSLSATQPLNTTEALIQKFAPIIQGFWVKSDYVTAITHSRSPYASRKSLDGLAAIEIKMDSLKKESVLAGASLNNHEGYQFAVLFKAGHKSNSIETHMPDWNVNTNFYELGYTVNGKDTTLVMYHYNKNNRLLDSVAYTKVLNNYAYNYMDYGISYLTNKALISGRYTTTDSTGTALKVEFNDEGKVLGFLEFVKYDINTDFVAGPENDLDQIYFDDYEKNQKQFLFKIKADTLNLYDVNKSADSIHLVWGKLKYKLVRVK